MRHSDNMTTVLLVAGTIAGFSAFTGCASMAQPTPEDRQQFYDATQEQVDQAIRDYMFDNSVMLVDEGEGRIVGEHENASIAAGVATGGSVKTRITFNYRESGDGTQVRASMLTDTSGRTVEPPAENYRQLFSVIGDYIDDAR